MELYDLTDKVALVTGGSRGLGREMVRAFARAGADVVITSRKMDACEALAKEVAVETGQQALPYACHVGYWDQLDGLVEAAYDQFGKIDILVNNAGMSPIYDNVAEVSEALYDKVLDVNLKGPFRLMALVGTRMAAGDGGSVINISSIGAIRPIPNTFGPRVRVNCIMCGMFFTDISKAWDMAAYKEIAKTMALRRGGDPREVIGAALYFASEASSYCTGAILRLDGGRP